MKIIAKVHIYKKDGKSKQKYLTIPKQEETKDWEEGDIVKLEKIEVP